MIYSSFSDKPTVKNVFQMAHEYQIPTVLKKAETALVGKIRSLGYHDVPVYFDYPGNPFEMLKFAETYESASLLSAAAERISMLTTDTFTSDSLYKDLHESTKNKILMYRLKRCDDGRRRDDTLDLVY